MPDIDNINHWKDTILRRYESYLKTSFFFKDPNLRRSFQQALRNEGALLKGPFPERARGFRKSLNSAHALARKWFSDKSDNLLPALMNHPLYVHQEQAIHATYQNNQNIIVATGTASGKTESFLYPILFELYRQHLNGELQEPGVRAMILYPMNALANDQRERLGRICNILNKSESEFKPTFGQYIGETPYNKKDSYRHASARSKMRLSGELIFREEMRANPPHILLTNYSMLEYLLIRPEDSNLFDNGQGQYWKFIVLDEAHQYRGAKGMEMGMLIRRLKQRLREGGQRNDFRCIATSATISSEKDTQGKAIVAKFAENLFGESFDAANVIFGEEKPESNEQNPRLFHVFLRALEGAFIIHKDGTDSIVLNRTTGENDNSNAIPLELALCRECGQHYYVGQERNGELAEAIRDPSNPNFGVEYYFPTNDRSSNFLLCRRCGSLSNTNLICGCNASIPVKKCASDTDQPDQLKKCEACDYQRGSIGDPVQEIIHGSDGPSAVITTALHELLPKDRRKVLAFADNRQDAAFFAGYAEDTYRKLRDRNLIFQALQDDSIDSEGLSIADIRIRLMRKFEKVGLFQASDTSESRNRQVLTSILREVISEEKRISLSGVGLIKWFVKMPDDLKLPQAMQDYPWDFTIDEGHSLLGYLLDEFRLHRAISLPVGAEFPAWLDVCPWPQWAYCRGPKNKRNNVSQWGHHRSTVVSHFLYRIIMENSKGSKLSKQEAQKVAINLMSDVWEKLQDSSRKHRGDEGILLPGNFDGQFQLNPNWLRVKLVERGDVWECNTCASLSSYNVRSVCPRGGCPGTLLPATKSLKGNHYKTLYEIDNLPPELVAEEHTAQIQSHEARLRQERFKEGTTHLLSSSTTFEIGVDLGNLDAVFLRNVPPEPFNYTQRVGRVGRRDNPGLALTYCRRNSHDLYHFENPEKHIIDGKVKPPHLQVTNEKIVLRHIAAVALSKFFRNPEGQLRFVNVASLLKDWSSPCATSDLQEFCKNNTTLTNTLHCIVPQSMHKQIGIIDNSWVEKIAGPDSHLAAVEAEVCADYCNMEKLQNKYSSSKKFRQAEQIQKHINTIQNERILDFLSRKAIIPKYGFPVDVVQLDIRSKASKETSKVVLQRDLSQAIAEYAAGTKVVASKFEWESCGIKIVPEKAWPIRYYQYDSAHNFKQSSVKNSPEMNRKYLVPIFGFVTPLLKPLQKAHRRAQRLYTTRPFFHGFDGNAPNHKPIILYGVQITKAQPGTLVILCEGKNREGFYICRSCGIQMTKSQISAIRGAHQTPWNYNCTGQLELFSLGHELNTDVIRLQFPQLASEWDAYSVAYAVLLGAAEALDVPNADLNVTIASGDLGKYAIVLYDNVPGGAGLVAKLEQKVIFSEMVRSARTRIGGSCGCDSSCYGCLRSYRNQFAHPHLNRKRAHEILSACKIPNK